VKRIWTFPWHKLTGIVQEIRGVRRVLISVQKAVPAFISDHLHHLRFLSHCQGCYQQGLEFNLKWKLLTKNQYQLQFTNESDFGRHCFHFYPRDVFAEVRACATRDGAICSKNSQIHIMRTISSIKILRFLLWVKCKCYVLLNPAVLLFFLLTRTSTWIKPTILESLNFANFHIMSYCYNFFFWRREFNDVTS